LRPFIGGKALPPAATRILLKSDLSASLLNEIEFYAAFGNVEFLVVGRQGPPVDMNVLRKELGFAISAPQTVVPVAEEVVEVPVPAAPVEEEEEVPPPQAEQAEGPQEPVQKKWECEELEGLKFAALRDIVTKQGGRVGGKSKAALINDILSAQSGA